MSAASCSRSTRGWGVPRAFLKLCGFFKSGAPSPPPPTSPPTTGRCTPSLVRVAFSPSRFLPARSFASLLARLSSSPLISLRSASSSTLSVPPPLSLSLLLLALTVSLPPPLLSPAPPRLQLFFRHDRLHRPARSARFSHGARPCSLDACTARHEFEFLLKGRLKISLSRLFPDSIPSSPESNFPCSNVDERISADIYYAPGSLLPRTCSARNRDA